MKIKESELQDILTSHYTGAMPRLRRLGDYYRGVHPILRGGKDPGKPDNRLVCNFCKSITDGTVGYFMGKPLGFDCADASMKAVVDGINAYNDEQFVESRLARDLSVYGQACEILWLDDDCIIRFKAIEPTGVIPVYDSGIEGALTAAIRVCDGGGSMCVEVWYGDYVERYSWSIETGALRLTDEEEHPFGQVPVNFYSNNADGTGDFESVLTLVDAYNRLQSESVNDYEMFADSYLAITGMSGTRQEDIDAIRRNRVILLDGGGSAQWLTKSSDAETIENLKSRIARDIYRFSGTVDLSEEVLGGGQLSGTAIRYRMTAFENRVSVTERFFKKGLQRRYELICAMLSAFGHDYDYRGVGITFNRNLPENE